MSNFAAVSGVFSQFGKFSIIRRMITAAVVLALLSIVSQATAALTVQPITWDVIGLDSNNVNTGPNIFVVGARVTNTGAAPVTNVAASFAWQSTNANINLSGPASLSVPTLAAGNFTDFYFNVAVTRLAAARDTARRYQITVTGDGESAVTTPANRQLYVERLVSQNRNDVTRFDGPTNVIVGQTYQYILESATATQGYEQISSFVNFPNNIFQILSVDSTYTVGGAQDKVYVDACGWDQINRQCVGPANTPSGKAGGAVYTVYTVKILAATTGGPAVVTSLIYDFSGSSYHYNSDYGTGINAKTVTAVAPAATGTINGHVFNDLNNNGVKDLGEPGLPDISVLIATTSNPSGSVFLTNSNGDYSQVVEAGNATVSIVTSGLPAGMVVTGTGTSPQTVLVPSGSPATATPIGLYQGPAISGRIFYDTNGNGIQDPDGLGGYLEFGIPVHAVTVGGIPTTTDPFGDFAVAVAAGPRVVSTAAPANHYLTTSNNPQTVTAVAGTVAQSSPIGFQERYAVQGTVFNDVNGDGIFNGADAGASGIGVQIVDIYGVTHTGTTNGSGIYSIPVPIGSATISFNSATFGGRVVSTANSPQGITVSNAANNASPLGLTAPAAAGPVVTAGTYVSPSSLTVTFDQAMGAGVLTPSNYTISGPGVGTLAASPDSITHLSGNVYLLTWNTGAMMPGQLLTVTVNQATVFNAGGTALGTPNSALIPVPAAPGGGGTPCVCTP